MNTLDALRRGAQVAVIEWYVMAEAAIGEVTAPDAEAALSRAREVYPHRALRVESVASAEVSVRELDTSTSERIYGRLRPGLAIALIVPARSNGRREP